MRKIAVIGGGAGGLFAALHASKEAKKKKIEARIVLFEGEDRVGKKLSITGSSMCNITNSEPFETFITRYHDKEKEIRDILSSYTVEDTRRFLESINIPLTTREDKKVFPSSFSAHQVIDELTSSCLSMEVIIERNRRISEVRRIGSTFVLHCKDEEYSPFDAVIIATGGFTYPQTGSRGDGYNLARSLGHSIEELRPGLTKIKVEDKALHALSGLTVEDVIVQCDTQKEVEGALLITHTGLSGPVIINNSRNFPKNGTIRVNYIRKTLKETAAEISGLCSRFGSKQFSSVLHSFGLSSSLLEYLCLKHEIDGRRKAAEVGKKVMMKAAAALTSDTYRYTTEGLENTGMISRGGIPTKEISLDTMESAIVPSLYFCGEVIDIDGETGGYNLQFAFSSGAIAGKSCIR
ncbi:MAG: aminoacetone oxidase family FAD-binding enzyme [Sphaerochaetaceae bacterium]|nr:aminoacetone oxidase family FAD-binding enzyme [Sphaerochaetaceae bacterium]MDC7247452.1 aminoacetone oxidase family FAD-binding enzyme [Sphaerochaetaceae bacterium]